MMDDSFDELIVPDNWLDLDYKKCASKTENCDNSRQSDNISLEASVNQNVSPISSSGCRDSDDADLKCSSEKDANGSPEERIKGSVNHLTSGPAQSNTDNKRRAEDSEDPSVFSPKHPKLDVTPSANATVDLFNDLPSGNDDGKVLKGNNDLSESGEDGNVFNVSDDADLVKTSDISLIEASPVDGSVTLEVSSTIEVSDATLEDITVNEPDNHNNEDADDAAEDKNVKGNGSTVGKNFVPVIEEDLTIPKTSHINRQLYDNATEIQADGVKAFGESTVNITEKLNLSNSTAADFKEERADTSNSAAAASTETFVEKPEVKKIASIVRDAKIISGIVANKSFNEIYDLLIDNRDRDDRLDFVAMQLISSADTTTGATNHSNDIFEEVQQVIAAIPAADANEVYAILESLPPSHNRVNIVITKLKPAIQEGSSVDLKPAVLRKDSSTADDPMLKNDPLFRDMRTIAKMFPDRDRNEIYALLEANHDKADRLQTVINEILRACGSQLEESENPQAQDSDGVAGGSTNTADGDSITQDVERMKNIFPDCDPNYLYEKLTSMKEKPDRTNLLAAEMFDKKDYPKLKDILEKEKENNQKEKAKKLTLTVEEFLKKFPDPVKTFGDMTKELSQSYKQHAEIALKNDFPMLRAGYLKSVLDKHKGHLCPAYQEISADVVSIPIKSRSQHKRFMKNLRSGKLPMPDVVDEYFYHELWFVQNEQSVLDYPKQKEEERRLRVEEAKLKGELYECCCCYDDECLFEDLANCPEGHLFCKTCVVRSTEAAFGEMKTKFPCLTGECDQDIPLSTLQTIISANLFSKIVRRMQEEEVQQANIPDLVTCPFCPFATIMPNPDDKVFKCLNPECLKESCRLCQEPNHIPLRCNEVEKKAATDMRTYIENKISEAVMRICGKCGKRFVKDMGCNKMTCVCGYTSCYACKAQGIDYDHFNHNKNCADTNPDVIHQRDMEEAAIKAKNEYLVNHPEAADIELKTDVKDMIQDFKKSSKKGQGPHFAAYDNGYDEYHDEEEEDDDEGYTEDETDEDTDDEIDVNDPYYAELIEEQYNEPDYGERYDLW